MRGSEVTVLSGVMNGAVSIEQLDLQSDDFIDHRHRNLFTYLGQRHRAQLPVDVSSVIEDLNAKSDDSCGEYLYISSMADVFAIEASMDRHIRQVRARAQAYTLSMAVEDIQQRLKSSHVDAEQAAVELIAQASKVQDLHTPTLEEVVAGVGVELDEEAGGERQVYMPSGVPEIDEHPDFMGLSRDGVSLILAASGVGKTSFIGALALGLLSQGRSVYLHGTETSPARRTRDLVFTLAAVDGRAWALQTRQLSELVDGDPLKANIQADVDYWREKLRKAQAWIQKADLHITGSGLTAERVSATARRLRLRGKAEVVLVDYLQDLSDSKGMKSGDRVAQVGHKSGILKGLAADLRIPVIVAAQVSGEKEGRKPAPPMMHDCQWSSTVHQDAEEVLSLYRADYYRDRGQNADGPEGVVQVVARKRRTGRLSTLDLEWDGPTKHCGHRHIRL